MEKEPVWTVSQITQAVKCCLETTFPQLSLRGEISNFKIQASGHWYFSLKDSESQIGAVMFRGDAQSVRRPPRDGDQVLVKGSLNVYAPRGNYQVVVRELSLAGQGDLLLKLEELKRKLLKKGYFSAERRKPLPKFPRTIGVVTSPTGAAIQDILNILTRRYRGFHLILNPVKVQGEGAAAEIAQAIDQFNAFQLADVLIVGRGGGSIEDLWAFNEEQVADAIFRSRIPIISAVGHETDHCIADYVADVRAPTPSAAAELVMAEQQHLLQYLEATQLRLRQTLQHLITQNRHRLTGLLRQPLFLQPYAFLGPKLQQLDDLREDLETHMKATLQQWRFRLQAAQRHLEALKPSVKLQHGRQRLAQTHQGLHVALTRQLAAARQKLEHVTYSLKAIDPKNLLNKGYSILFSEKEGCVISSIRTLSPSQRITILLGDGKASATVGEIFDKERKS